MIFLTSVSLRRLAAVAALGLSCALAGCGGDDKSVPPTPESSTPTVPSTPQAPDSNEQPAAMRCAP